MFFSSLIRSSLSFKITCFSNSYCSCIRILLAVSERKYNSNWQKKYFLAHEIESSEVNLISHLNNPFLFHFSICFLWLLFLQVASFGIANVSRGTVYLPHIREKKLPTSRKLSPKEERKPLCRRP